MIDDTLKGSVAQAVFNALRKHPQWDGVDPAVIEQELDIPVADPEEEEEGYYMGRKDKVKDILEVMGALIAKGYVEGSISSVDDRLVYSGIQLTEKGRDYLSGLK